MSEHDVPAERGRDELRERLATTLAALVALRDVVRDSGKLNGMEYDALGVQVNRAIAKAEAALAPQEAREGERCQAVHFTRSMQCKLPARHGGEHIAGSGEGETRWTTEVADRLDASLAAPASGEPSGAEAAVREAPPISDTEVARIIEAVEAHCGMGHGAWDMVAARGLVEGFAAALGAPAPAEATSRERKALDEIWEIASMADQSDPAFSAWGALETIAEIVRGFDEAEDQCDKCGAMRSQGEGGTTFTVCDACWDKLHGAAEATKRSESLRRVRTAEWWGDRLDDIAVLRAGLNARGIDGTDAQIAEAYAMWSDKFYAAGWVSVGDTAPPSFVGWAEREWLAPEPSGPYRLTGAAIRNRRTAAGMSLRELAAAVGISNVEMGEIERGIRRPDEKTVTAIRNAIDAARCGLPSPVRGYGPCILRRGHSGPGAHQHGETGRIMQAYHAPDTSEEGAGDAE